MRDKIFDAIVKYKETHDGNSPSSRAIGDVVGLSQAGVMWHTKRDLRLFRLDGHLCVKGGEWSRAATLPNGVGTNLFEE